MSKNLLFLNLWFRHLSKYHCHGISCREVGRCIQKPYRWCCNV